MTSDFVARRWGFCGTCERWHTSDAWGAADSPTCPVCGAPPLLLEEIVDGRARLRLDLEVAVGPVGNRRFLEE